MGGINFNPDKDIPDLSGKVIFITGGTAGLGRESVLALAKHSPEHIYFSGRDAKRAAAVTNEIRAVVPNAKLTFIECDLTSLVSVTEAAKRITSESQRLDVLMCNAGVMVVPPNLTKEGYEIQFGTNHVAHALLVKLLLPTLLRTAEEPNSDVRIIMLSSSGAFIHPAGGIDFTTLRTTFSGWKAYGQSKIANILYAAELARRYPSITTVSIHPGVALTGLIGDLGFLNKATIYVYNFGCVKTPEEVSHHQLWAATADKATMVSGTFYYPIGVLGRHDKYSKSEKLATELWEWTQKELGAYQI